VAFASDLSESLVVPPLEGADTSARNHQGYARIGGHRRLVDLTQIHGGVGEARRVFRWCRRHRHMQLIAVVPHQLARADLVGHIN
jgi:hypothetical protein